MQSTCRSSLPTNREQKQIETQSETTANKDNNNRITYGSEAWTTASTRNQYHLQIIVNKALRIATSAPSYVSNKQIKKDLDFPTLEEITNEIRKKKIEKMKEHNNNLIKNVV